MLVIDGLTAVVGTEVEFTVRENAIVSFSGLAGVETVTVAKKVRTGVFQGLPGAVGLAMDLNADSLAILWPGTYGVTKTASVGAVYVNVEGRGFDGL